MNNLSTHKTRQLIDNMDFSMIINKLVSHQGWSQQNAKEICNLYKNYLFLSAKYPEKMLPPSEEVDEFWHAHILDTHKYHDDCNQIFRHYLHHYPYFGIDGHSSMADNEIAFSETQSLYFSEFGEYIYEVRTPFQKLISLGRIIKNKFTSRKVEKDRNKTKTGVTI